MNKWRSLHLRGRAVFCVVSTLFVTHSVLSTGFFLPLGFPYSFLVLRFLHVIYSWNSSSRLYFVFVFWGSQMRLVEIVHAELFNLLHQLTCTLIVQTHPYFILYLNLKRKKSIFQYHYQLINKLSGLNSTELNKNFNHYRVLPNNKIVFVIPSACWLTSLGGNISSLLYIH